MSEFLFRLGRRCARHPFRTLGAWVLVAVAVRIDDNLVDETDIWVDDDGELFVGWADLIADVEPSQRPVLTINVQDLVSVENRSDATIRISGIDEDAVDVERPDDGGPVTFA